jgi:hypothetical protein
MIDLESILIPEDLLTQHHAEARAKSEYRLISVNNALDNYLVLTHVHRRLPPEWHSQKLILYNRYFWFLQFARTHCEHQGNDAGLEQQALQILESSMGEIDWTVIEAIEARTRSASRSG